MKRLLVARSLRNFGDGFVALILPVYLTALGFSPFEVGLVASAAMLGSALLAFFIGFLEARYCNRQLFLAMAGLTIATGVAFSVFDDYSVLLIVAFAGTVNPSTGSASPFMPLERTVLAREVSSAERTRTFASYSFIGALAGAMGALAAATPDLLGQLGLGQIAALKAMFVVYALLGLAGALVYAGIPARHPSFSQDRFSQERPAAVLGPSRQFFYKLAALSYLDAFAGGFVVQSLLALWLFVRFDISLTAAALFFAWSGVLSAFSFPVAASLSRRIGLINTMVCTHITSSIFLILAAIAPTLTIALILLLLRAAFSQMDVPIRPSYVMPIVTEPERTAATSFTSLPRSLAASTSPALAGALLAASFRGWPLVICGVLKIICDLLLLSQLRRVKPTEEG
ncbi:MFS transporter [Hyphomicrobium sp.]|uniref:MFS transporter n=1 Tax=Hyphomicrobium sp. TaxID=82 RepID=UPI003F6F204D